MFKKPTEKESDQPHADASEEIRSREEILQASENSLCRITYISIDRVNIMERDHDQPLSGFIEMDDAYLGGERIGCQPGRGAEGKIPFVAAVETTNEVQPSRIKLSVVKGLSSSETLEWIIEQAKDQGMKVVIPPRKNRKIQREYDQELYKLRHLVENAFLHLKRWRGIATRYAKNTASFLAAVQIRWIALWTNISCVTTPSRVAAKIALSQVE